MSMCFRCVRGVTVSACNLKCSLVVCEGNDDE